MVTRDQFDKCPICNFQLQEQKAEVDVQCFSYKCPRCGTFILCDFALSDQYFPKVRHLVSTWIQHQNANGIFYPVVGGNMNGVTDNWFQNLEHMGFPNTVPEKLDALLLVYSDQVTENLNSFIKISPNMIAKVAAKTIDEIRGLNRLLEQLDYIELHQYLGENFDDILIKSKGWFRIDELNKNKIVSESAFIAMWFGDCTDNYRKAAITAIRACGYKPLIADQHEFNGFIMDQVIALIRQSRFIVADFTCRPEIDDAGVPKVKQGVRGGVYWEAGMAFGLDKPYIQTCEDNIEAKRRIHFDIDQYNTIFWKPDELNPNIRNLSEPITNPNFAERLAMRILSTIGKGSYISD